MSMTRDEGVIRKALSGFYYVQCGGDLVTCRARGKFRYQKITPLVGDRVVIARQPDGIADRLRDALWARPQSVLLCGGAGPAARRTLLRDLIRQLSDRFGWRICVVDERLELAACASGVPQFRLGARTDVLSGAPRRRASSCCWLPAASSSPRRSWASSSWARALPSPMRR